MLDLAPIALLAYLLGSIPFGLLLTRFAGAGDLRKIGSGNIGATNVLRTGRRDIALATLLLDGGKGAVAVLIAYRFGTEAAFTAAFCAVLGHLFPVWLGFKGGKGVATTLGVLLALDPPVGAAACLIWLVVAYATRYSSLAALVAIGTSPLAAFFARGLEEALLAALLAILVVIRHHENIGRLAQGTEGKIKLGRG
ncbi:MAG TPA: glycerol-3-phosphate 1-O-acyltransferase PlsY [Aliidongia sp.]|nr:glycerol-3-phosphate 1-O-acyltransferase PlsY [Aliidongia sp.]